jgi:hypothetical protein
MKTPNLKQTESAVRLFWFNNEEPRNKEEIELLNSFDLKGLKVYRQLLKNDWQDTLESIYPFTQKILGDEWDDITTRYIKTFPPEHFNLNRLAEKFASYLLQHEQQLPAFLPQLADYEWLELEIMEHPTKVDKAQESAPSTVEDFMELIPSINPTLSIRDYDFDIIEIAEAIEQDKDIKTLAAPTRLWIAAFRPPNFYYCQFLGISEHEVLLLRQAMTNPITYGELAKLMISLCSDVAPETASLQFINTIERFHEAGIFV